MLHANSLSKETFRPQIDALKDVRRLIAVDLPGHGDSSNGIDPRRTYSIPGYADSFMEALAAIGLQRFIVLGHSLGGHVALEMIALEAGIEGAMIFGTPPAASTPGGFQAGFVSGPDMDYTGKPVQPTRFRRSSPWPWGKQPTRTAFSLLGPIGPKLRFWPTQRTDDELLIK